MAKKVDFTKELQSIKPTSIKAAQNLATSISIDPNDVVYIDLEDIQIFPQLRGVPFDQLETEELEEGILSAGLIQPITVCRIQKSLSKYAVICGFRRLHSYKKIYEDYNRLRIDDSELLALQAEFQADPDLADGKQKRLARLQQIMASGGEFKRIKALLRADLEFGNPAHQEMIDLIQVQENFLREDPDTIEIAASIGHLAEKYGLSERKLAEKIGKPKTFINENLTIYRAIEPLRSTLSEVTGTPHFPNLRPKILLKLAQNVEEPCFERLCHKALKGATLKDIDNEVIRSKQISPESPNPILGFQKKISKLVDTMKKDMFKVVDLWADFLDPEDLDRAAKIIQVTILNVNKMVEASFDNIKLSKSSGIKTKESVDAKPQATSSALRPASSAPSKDEFDAFVKHANKFFSGFEKPNGTPNNSHPATIRKLASTIGFDRVVEIYNDLPYYAGDQPAGIFTNLCQGKTTNVRLAQPNPKFATHTKWIPLDSQKMNAAILRNQESWNEAWVNVWLPKLKAKFLETGEDLPENEDPEEFFTPSVLSAIESSDHLLVTCIYPEDEVLSILKIIEDETGRTVVFNS